MIISKILPCGCHCVNSFGKVYSKIIQFSEKGKIGIQTKIGKNWKVLKPILGQSGYEQVNIHGRIIRCNRLVAFNFIPNPTALPEVHHRNGIKIDNRIENLKWGNQKQNAQDRDGHGNTARGERQPNHKLNKKKILKIRILLSKNLSLSEIAKKFNVSKKLILLVKQKKIWKHII